MVYERRGWVIFDGDNTLWNVESLYDAARRALCQLVMDRGGSPERADSFQRARDAELYAEHGYSPKRFPQSFVDTIAHCFGRVEPMLEHEVRQIAASVFTTKAAEAADVDVAFRRLRVKYTLGVLTAGERSVQAQRLEGFGRGDQFEAVRIVERKNVETLQAFLDDHQIDGSSSWVVGDSIRSDIEPAVALGIRAVHLDVANWHPVEQGERQLPTGVGQAKSLLEVCQLLSC